ncbi:hypothetical protein KR018_001639, partial [Drosophila ironensis]
TQGDLVYKFMNVECNVNPVFVSNVSCSLKAIDWNKSVVNMDCFLLSQLNPTLRVQVFAKDYTNQYKPFLIDVKVNVCEIIKRRNFLPYGVMFWRILQEFTNANHSCPFSGHLMARNGYMPSSYLPPFPHGFYLFKLEFWNSSTHLFGTVKFFVQVMEMIKLRNKSKTV